MLVIRIPIKDSSSYIINKEVHCHPHYVCRLNHWSLRKLATQPWSQGVEYLLSLTKHFHVAQGCIFPFSNSLSSIERGNGAADTYSEGITVMISYFCAFLTHFVSFPFPFLQISMFPLLKSFVKNIENPKVTCKLVVPRRDIQDAIETQLKRTSLKFNKTALHARE